MHEVLTISVREGVLQLQTHEIVYLEASRNYTRIHLHNSSSILSAKTLKEYENKLSAACFCRVRSSHLVNTEYITSVNSNHELILSQQISIRIAKRKYRDVIRRLNAEYGNDKKAAIKPADRPVQSACFTGNQDLAFTCSE